MQCFLLFKIVLGKTASAAKKLNTFLPPNRSDDLCLFFCFYPLSFLSLTYCFFSNKISTTFCFVYCIIDLFFTEVLLVYEKHVKYCTLKGQWNEIFYLYFLLDRLYSTVTGPYMIKLKRFRELFRFREDIQLQSLKIACPHIVNYTHISTLFGRLFL